MRPTNIEFHIEELGLHGFAPGDRYRIGAAVEQELQRLFAEQGASPRLTQAGEIDRLDGGAFDVSHGAKAEIIGAQIAQTLFGRLT